MIPFGAFWCSARSSLLSNTISTPYKTETYNANNSSFPSLWKVLDSRSKEMLNTFEASKKITWPLMFIFHSQINSIMSFNWTVARTKSASNCRTFTDSGVLFALFAVLCVSHYVRAEAIKSDSMCWGLVKKTTQSINHPVHDNGFVSEAKMKKKKKKLIKSASLLGHYDDRFLFILQSSERCFSRSASTVRWDGPLWWHVIYLVSVCYPHADKGET